MSAFYVQVLLYILIGALSLLAAVLYRALASASTARIEEINEEHGNYSEIPDLGAALVVAGAVKLVFYTALVVLIGHGFFEGGTSAARYAKAFGIAAFAILSSEAVALVIAGYHAERPLYRWMPLVALFAAGGEALVTAGRVVAGLLARIEGREGPPPPDEEAEEEMLDAVVEGEREGVIEDQEREMIESIIEFKDSEVSEIMTPRTDLTMVNEAMTLQAAMEIAIESGHSRLPVAAENADNIVGILHVKDILQQVIRSRTLESPVRGIMRGPYFVPETKRIRELLQEFRATNVHMAIALDEYGGTSGIVTIEDIIEEIVGEIEDEYDRYQPPEIRQLGPGRIIAAGTAGVGEVNDAIGTQISEEEEYDTIAGFVLYRTGRIPGSGETIELDGVRFRIIEADERRIKRMALTVPGSTEERRAQTRS